MPLRIGESVAANLYSGRITEVIRDFANEVTLQSERGIYSASQHRSQTGGIDSVLPVRPATNITLFVGDGISPGSRSDSDDHPGIGIPTNSHPEKRAGNADRPRISALSSTHCRGRMLLVARFPGFSSARRTRPRAEIYDPSPGSGAKALELRRGDIRSPCP